MRQTRFQHASRTLSTLFAALVLSAASLGATPQQPDPSSLPVAAPAKPALPPDTANPVGPDDVLLVVFWGDKDMSAEVIVRPDGMISLPLINDIKAAGLTPAELGAKLQAAADRFAVDPSVTVMVKQTNSRKVYIQGMVEKSGAYSLTGPMTTLQLIATAGGFKDFAKTKSIVIIRSSGGREERLKFNYGDVVNQKEGSHDTVLQPGDRVIVP